MREEVHGLSGVQPVSLWQDKRTVAVRAVTLLGLLIALVPQSDALSPAHGDFNVNSLQQQLQEMWGCVVEVIEFMEE